MDDRIRIPAGGVFDKKKENRYVMIDTNAHGKTKEALLAVVQTLLSSWAVQFP